MASDMDWSCRKSDNSIAVYFGPFSKGEYELLQEPFCHFCAHSGVTTEDCSWHHSIDGFERIYAMGRYVPYPSRAKDDLLSYHIWGFKKYANYAQPLGKGLDVAVRSLYAELMESTMLVPIPLTAEKLSERGYNQALELARVLGDCLEIQVEEVLLKTRNVDMRRLNWEERKEAVEGLYALRDSANEAEGHKILLIDDVVTTGFTVSECASLLQTVKPVSVNVLVAGRTIH